MNLVIFDLVNTVMALIIISALITLAWYLRILVPWGCYGWISNTKWVKDKKLDLLITSRLSRILNICKEEVKPFPPVIEQVEKYTECFPMKCAVAFRSTLVHLTCASYSTF